MEAVEFPRFTGLVKRFLEDRLAESNMVIPVVTKNPTTLPVQWIRLSPQGGKPTLYEWRAMMNVYACGKNDIATELLAQKLHAWLIAAAGVDILVPEWSEPVKWVRLVQHISGPVPLEDDEDLPHIEEWRSVVTWHVLPVPKG